jgi:hypothetical protein
MQNGTGVAISNLNESRSPLILGFLPTVPSAFSPLEKYCCTVSRVEVT